MVTRQHIRLSIGDHGPLVSIGYVSPGWLHVVHVISCPDPTRHHPVLRQVHPDMGPGVTIHPAIIPGVSVNMDCSFPLAVVFNNLMLTVVYCYLFVCWVNITLKFPLNKPL